MSERALERLCAKLGDDVLETHSALGDDTAVVAPQVWLEAATYLRDEPDLSFDMFVDLCCVDYPERDPRFEVVMHLYSVDRAHRIRLKTRVGARDLETDETVELDSVTALWPAANWFERECYDMSGVVFRGHPDLRRILLYPEFVGHPLRKDYPAQKTQPLVPYREEADVGIPLGKLAPFGPDEGMSFPRRPLPTTAED